MMYLKSRTWVLSIFLMLILVLSACGGQVETVGEPTEAPKATEAPVEEPTEEPVEEEPTEEPVEEAPTEAPVEEEPTEEPVEEEPTEEASEAPAGDPIKLGALAPLSAPGTVVGGEAMRDAMNIAVEELNASGGILGRPVELVVVDTEGLPERGTAVMEKLISQDEVVAVGGGYHSSVGVAAKEVAHDNGIPVVFAETWNDTITSSKLPEIFRVAPLSSEVSAVDVKFIQNLPGIAKVVIVTENTDYGIPAAEDTTNGLAEAGIDAVTFGVDIGTQDFAGIVERVKAEDPDMIMVLATGEAAYNFQQQAADAGIGPGDLPILCNQVSLESDAFWTNVPDGNYCFVRKVGLPTELYNDVAKAFVATYTEQTGKSAAESYALEAYDSIKIIAQAIEEAGTTDSEAIIAALENIEYEGALGTITFPYGQQNPIPEGVEDKFWHQFPDPAITIVQYQEQDQDSEEAPVVFPSLYSTGDAMLVGPDGPVAVAVGGDAPAETDEPVVEASGEPIVLGGLAPLSAPGTVVGGEAMRDAMNIAIDELNASGGILGRPVELVVVDTEGLPERGTAVMEKLISQDEVVAVGGGYHSSVGVAAKEVAHDNGIPVVFAETWNDTITSSKLPEIFRIAPLSSEVSAVDVKFIQNLPGIEKVAILTENTDYGIPAAEDTTNGLAEAGIDAVTFGVDIGTQDFAGIVERVKAENPDMIMVLATGEAAYNFQQQAADAGIGPGDLPTLCNQVSLESEAFWTNVPDGNYCFVRKVGLPTELYNDVATGFVATYTEQTGKSAAESYALEAYDSIKIIAQAIEEAATTDPEAIIEALENIEYEGALGTITFPYGQQNPIPEGVEDKFWHQFPDPAITIVQYQEEGQDSEEAPVVFPSLYSTGDAMLVGPDGPTPIMIEGDAADAGAESAEEPAAEASGEPIVLGGLAPLSAPGTVVGGEAMRDAMNIAIDELNASGGILGRPVELVVVDTEGLPERGTAVMEKLISQDEVVAVGGGYHSSVGVAAKEVAHDNGIPVVFAETWNDTITSSKLPEIFRIAPLSSEVSAVDVKFIQNLPGIEKVAILTENTDYGIPAAEDTTNGLAEAGIDAVTFGVDIGTQDFAGIVERVKAENPDMIMVLATGEAAYNFQQQAADAGIGPGDLPTLCNQVSLESEAFWTNVPDGNYCFVRKVGLPTELYNDVAKTFVATYTEQTGKSAAESYALEAYDSIKIIAQAIEEAATTDPAAIIDALENIEYEGALGTITFPYGQQNAIPDGVADKFWHQFPDPAITIVQYQEEGQDSEEAPVVFPSLYSTGDAMLVGPDGPAPVTIEGDAGDADAESAEEPAAEASGEPIVLGGLAPLSAPGTVVGGEAMRDAMNIAVDELNASGGILGRPVELVIVDTEGLPERGTAVMEKLISQDEVVAVGGGYHSSVGVAAKEVAHDNGIPVVFAETWNDTITSSKLPEIFRIAPLSSEVSAVDVKFIQSLPGIEKVAILTENTDYGIPAAEDTTNGLAEAGIDAVTFGVDIGTQDFAGIVERVKAEQPDMIMVLATGEAAYNFQQQAADAGIGPGDLPTLCNQVSLESEAFWTNVPDGNNCFVRKVGLPTELYNDVAKGFVSTYAAQTGKSAAESYALEAYDSIKIIAQAIEEAGTTDPTAIIDALENIEYQGALGTIRFPYGQQNPLPDDVPDKFWHQFPDPAITIVQYQEEGQDSEEAPVVYPELYQTGQPVLVGQ